MVKRYQFVLCLLSLSSLIFCVSAVLAADQATSSGESSAVGNVSVRVRAVRASEMLPTRAERRAAGALQVDPLLVDLQEKLRKLHYRKFELLDSQEKLVPLNQRQMITLVDGNELTVRPLYIKAIKPGDRHRVGMWINWKDGAGMEVLDTRMHFFCGENMLTGTDAHGETGLILAIRVNPE